MTKINHRFKHANLEAAMQYFSYQLEKAIFSLQIHISVTAFLFTEFKRFKSMTKNKNIGVVHISFSENRDALISYRLAIIHS